MEENFAGIRGPKHDIVMKNLQDKMRLFGDQQTYTQEGLQIIDVS